MPKLSLEAASLAYNLTFVSSTIFVKNKNGGGGGGGGSSEGGGEGNAANRTHVVYP